MGDLGVDTAIEPAGEGAWRARLSSDWAIWGPNGGYVAAILLRAAGEHAWAEGPDPSGAAARWRPVSMTVQFLGVGRFEDATLTTRTQRRTRRAQAVAVTMVQGDRPLAEAQAWFALDGLPGLEHDVSVMPVVPGPDDLRTFDQIRVDHGLPDAPFRFFDNIEQWPVHWSPEWPPAEPLPPVSESWYRFRPGAVFEDQLVDAARLVVLLDTMGWPAASRHHAWAWPVDAPPPWVAPSLDLHVRFHRFAPGSDRLLCRTTSPVAAEGFITTEGRVWAEDGTLLASAASQLLCTPTAPA